MGASPRSASAQHEEYFVDGRLQVNANREACMAYRPLTHLLRTVTLLVMLSPYVALAEDLVDDYSRGDLLRYSMSVGPNAKAFPDGFTFPNDAKARPKLLSGVDVSHYDGVINWPKGRGREIRFGYGK